MFYLYIYIYAFYLYKVWGGFRELKTQKKLG